MNLPQFSVRYPVTVAMLMLAIGILGVISLNRLGTDLLPAIYNPRIVVELQSGERSPQEMEQRFARRLEGELGTVSKVVDVRAVCSLGRVLATATFSWGTDMDFALLDVQKKIANYESDPEVNRVTIARYDPQEEPIMIYALQSGGEHDLDELRRIAENVIKRALERLDGVARVQIYGGIKREVRVELNEYLLEAYGLTPTDVTGKIRQANANASGGRLVQQEKAYLIKGIGNYTSVEDVAATVVGYKSAANGASNDTTALGAQQTGSQFAPDKVPIYLSDVAQVSYAPEERTDVVRLNSQESVGFYIYKEAEDNTVRVAEQIVETIARMQDDSPSLEFTLVYSQAAFIDSAIGEVKASAIIGVILAVLILYVFLRNLGATIIISVAIPLSILATFTLMYFQNLTLNMMTLGGLALGAGMLVDNAIVVIENIFRRRQLGEESADAAIRGASEVGVAIFASTLTTIVVFLPVVYVHGVAAELFKDQAWVVAYSLLASLVVAFLLIPTLAARLLFKDTKVFEQQFLQFAFYEKTLQWAMNHRNAVVLAAIFLIAVAAALLPVVGSEFVPRSGENQLQVDINLPPGAPLEKTSAVLAGVEERTRQILGERLNSLFSTVNVSSSQSLFTGTEQGEHRASITINLAPAITPETAIAALRPHLNLPDIATTFRIRETSLQQTIGTGSAPIVVEVRGSELPTLQETSARVAEALRQLNGLHNVETSFQSGRPEINLRIDRLLAASLGLDVQQIGQRVKERLAGEIVSDFYSEGEDRNIRVAFTPATLAELSDMPIRAPNGAVLRLRDISQLISGEGPKEIQRHNQSRIAHVTAQLEKGMTLSRAVAAVEKTLINIALPPDYELRFAGEEASRGESFEQMKFALILSIVLVYMVMAALFENLLHPFTILLTLPLAGAGVVFAFLLVGEPLSVMAYIGVIMLAGIAVNNAIVLVDYINRLRAAGMARREAILQAGRDRLRPILMTTATTILALAPLAIGLGEGARLRAPMAIAVIGGLITSTLLTLVVIPVVYELIDGVREVKRNA
ncbi:efflux RND transporter permease subunit [candidate division KSB1 bacterium]|nr:efflux RND transporter permease subunit [candidate division KSB1 bacterium]